MIVLFVEDIQGKKAIELPFQMNKAPLKKPLGVAADALDDLLPISYQPIFSIEVKSISSYNARF